MHSERKLTIATANVLFGGVELKRRDDCIDLKDWLLVHYMVLIAKSERFVRDRLEGGVANLVKRLILQNPGFEIFIVGDFNSDEAELDAIFGKLPLARYSSPSFPNSNLYKQMNKKRWFWLKLLMGLNNGQRSLDHVITTKNWSNSGITAVETTSDHLALVFNFDSNFL